MAQAAHDRGELILAGAFSDPFDRALFVWTTADEAAVVRFVESDPYVANGLVDRLADPALERRRRRCAGRRLAPAGGAEQVGAEDGRVVERLGGLIAVERRNGSRTGGVASCTRSPSIDSPVRPSTGDQDRQRGLAVLDAVLGDHRPVDQRPVLGRGVVRPVDRARGACAVPLLAVGAVERSAPALDTGRAGAEAPAGRDVLVVRLRRAARAPAAREGPGPAGPDWSVRGPPRPRSSNAGRQRMT